MSYQDSVTLERIAAALEQIVILLQALIQLANERRTTADSQSQEDDQ